MVGAIVSGALLYWGRYCAGAHYCVRDAIVLGTLVYLKRYYIWGYIVSGALLCWGRYCVRGRYCVGVTIV